MALTFLTSIGKTPKQQNTHMALLQTTVLTQISTDYCFYWQWTIYTAQ